MTGTPTLTLTRTYKANRIQPERKSFLRIAQRWISYSAGDGMGHTVFDKNMTLEAFIGSRTSDGRYMRGFFLTEDGKLRLDIDDDNGRIYVQRPATDEDRADEDRADRISSDGWIDCEDEPLDYLNGHTIEDLIAAVNRQAPVPREPEKARILLGNDYLIDLLDTLSREADEREWYELPAFEITIKRLPNEGGFVAVGLPSLLNMAD